jgi:hypothetical protein
MRAGNGIDVILMSESGQTENNSVWDMFSGLPLPPKEADFGGSFRDVAKVPQAA